MSNFPLVSIILPVYNACSTINQTISSIITQSFQNYEVLITDDCSTDNTIKILKNAINNDKRFKIFCNKTNQGPAHTRNNSIKNSIGRYIAFIDSDDTWHKDKLKNQIDFMCNFNYAFTFTYYKKFNICNNKSFDIYAPDVITYDLLLKTNYIGCSTAIYDSKILGKLLMPDIRQKQDWALWLLILKYTNGYCLNEFLTEYKVGRSNTVSSNKLKASRYAWNVLYSIERKNIFLSVYYFLHYSIRGIFRTYFRPKI